MYLKDNNNVADIRLNKLIKQYRVGLDALVDYLLSLGIEVPRSPNAKVPIDVLPALDEHYGYERQEIEKYVISDELYNQVKTTKKELRQSLNQILKLASEGRIGQYSVPYIEHNTQLLNSLTKIAKDEPAVREDIQRFIDSLIKELLGVITGYRERSKHKKGYAMKSDFIVNIRNRYLKALDEMDVDTILMTVEVGWDKVRFGNGRIILNLENERPLNCNCPQSRETYNLFRAAFEARVKPLRVIFHSKLPPEIEESPEFKEVFQYLEIRDDIRLGKFSRRIDLARFIQTSRINFQDTFLPKDRSPYIQYLIDKQDSNYRFIPVFEKSLIEEDAFLFTIKRSQLYIIWENLNENTATYVFPVGSRKYEEVLQSIYDYASSDTDYKRMRMHYGQAKDIMGSNCRILYHNDLNQWKREINSLR